MRARLLAASLVVLSCRSREAALSELREKRIPVSREALCGSASSGTVEDVKLLLDAGVEINIAADDPNPPLVCAARGCQPESIQLLLEKGAPVDRADTEGKTPLIAAAYHCAGARGDTAEKTARALIDAGANVHAKDLYGNTALLAAVSRDNFKFVEMLTEAGVELNVTDARGETALDLARARQTPNAPAIAARLEAAMRSRGPRPAAKQLDPAAARAELARLGYADSPDSFLNAARSPDSRPLELFLASGVDPNVHVQKMTALRTALQYQPRHVSLLIRAGAIPDREDEILAVRSGDLPTLDAILPRRREVEPDPAIRRGGLFIAAQMGWPEGVQRFLAAGADPNSPGVVAAAAASHAARDNAAALKVLLEHGAKLHAQQRDEESPLEAAVNANAVDGVRVLLERGAPITANDTISIADPAPATDDRRRTLDLIKTAIAAMPAADRRRLLEASLDHVAAQLWGLRSRTESNAVNLGPHAPRETPGVVRRVFTQMPLGLWQIDRFTVTRGDRTLVTFHQDAAGAWAVQQ